MEGLCSRPSRPPGAVLGGRRTFATCPHGFPSERSISPPPQHNTCEFTLPCPAAYQQGRSPPTGAGSRALLRCVARGGANSTENDWVIKEGSSCSPCWVVSATLRSA